MKGKLKRKNDANSNALKYHLLAFLRKRPVDTINYGWPLLNCAKADFSPEAIFGDPVFREFLLDEGYRFIIHINLSNLMWTFIALNLHQ